MILEIPVQFDEIGVKKKEPGLRRYGDGTNFQFFGFCFLH